MHIFTSLDPHFSESLGSEVWTRAAYLSITWKSAFLSFKLFSLTKPFTHGLTTWLSISMPYDSAATVAFILVLQLLCKTLQSHHEWPFSFIVTTGKY